MLKLSITVKIKASTNGSHNNKKHWNIYRNNIGWNVPKPSQCLHTGTIKLIFTLIHPESKQGRDRKAGFVALCQSHTLLPQPHAFPFSHLSVFLPPFFYTVKQLWQLRTLMSAALCLESGQVDWLMTPKSSLFSLPLSLSFLPNTLQNVWVTSSFSSSVALKLCYLPFSCHNSI